MRDELQAIKACVPAFLQMAKDAPAHTPADLLTAVSPQEASLLETFAGIVTCVAQPRNSKLLAMLPELLASGQLLPVLNSHSANARLLTQVLHHDKAGPLLRHLLSWQNRARKLLLQLLRHRSDAQTVCTPAFVIVCTVCPVFFCQHQLTYTVQYICAPCTTLI